MLIYTKCFILVTRRARDTVRVRGLRKSKRVEECSYETYAKEEDEEKEEEVLNTSHQYTFTTS